MLHHRFKLESDYCRVQCLGYEAMLHKRNGGTIVKQWASLLTSLG